MPENDTQVIHMPPYHMIDSHAHLSASPLVDEIDALMTRAEQAGITQVINICTGSDSLQKGIALSKKYPGVLYNAAGVHPHDAEKDGDQFFHVVKESLENLVAIGETGLDYHYQHSSREAQIAWLIKHLQLASQCRLPVVIHCREAFADLFSILDEHYPTGKGVLHCFTGTLAEAKQVIQRGWYLSLSGVVTFKKSMELREVARYVPLEQLLIETDAPFLAPQSKRGKQNEPSYLPETAAMVAAVKGITTSEVAQATSQNASAFFSL